MFRLNTFGSVSLSRNDGRGTLRRTPRRRLALLAMLAVSGDRTISRDKLVSYFWPERDDEHARHSLSQLLYEARRQLGKDVFVDDLDDVRLNPAVIGSDVADFLHQINSVELERAVVTYRGPFLDGFFLGDAREFEHWVAAERSRLSSLYGCALEKLAAASMGQGDHERAVELYRRRAALEPLNAKAVLRLMQALLASGDRTGALQQALVYERDLRSELEIAPDPEVAEFVERLRKNAAPSSDGKTALYSEPLRTGFSVTEPLSNGSDTGGAPDRIKTVTNKGFRYGAPAFSLAALLLIVLTAFLSTGWWKRGSSTEKPFVVVMGEVRSSESNLGVALGEALRAELEPTAGLRLLRESAIKETLGRMGLPAETPLTEAVALEIAQRSAAGLVLVGSAEEVGLGAQIAVRLLDPHTGSVVATLAERPATAAEILPSVTRISKALRDRVLGAQGRGNAAPLPAVTTSSLEALRMYALGRQAHSRRDFSAAIEFAQAALVHDSAFALGHYFLGDLLWFVDRQKESEEHLGRAHALSRFLPPRERLVVKARYQQLIEDRPDSALVYWELLRASFPDDATAFEGMAWSLRALGRFKEAAEAAGAALELDASTLSPNVTNRLYALVEARDTLAAFAFERTYATSTSWPYARIHAALLRGDWEAAIVLADEGAGSRSRAHASALRQVALLTGGRTADAASELEQILEADVVQFPPRGILLQARVELSSGGSRDRARARAQQALRWIREADLSPPAYGRLLERTADVAARAGDGATIAAVRRMILQKDAGRDLRSYRLALLSVEACAAFVNGDLRSAARLAAQARESMFFGRSLATLIMLEADARRALGEHDRADSLFRIVAFPGQVADGDPETWLALRPIAVRSLEAR